VSRPRIRWPSADGDLRRVGRNLIGLLFLSALAAIVLARAYRLGVAFTLVTLLIGGGAPAGVYLAWESFRQAAGAGARKRSSAVADHEQTEAVLKQLAETVRTQWGAEYKARTYNDPSLTHRDIEASWIAADASLTLPWDKLIELALTKGYKSTEPGKWARTPLALAGLNQVDLRQILDKVPTGWLVVLGKSGSGKTMLMLRTVLELIKYRSPGDPVPVVVSMSSWNPKDDSLREWLEKRLPVDYAGLGASIAPGETKRTVISVLLEQQKIIPILDGLDEMPVKARMTAVNQLNLAFDDPARPPHLVVTCRTAEYSGAVRIPENGKGRARSPLEAAAAIELNPLDVDKVSSYLGNRGDDERWARVDAQLKDDPQQVLFQALNTPLYASLASEIYNPIRPEDRGEPPDPDELCRHSDVQSVKHHLLDDFIPAVYAKERSAEEQRAADEGEEPGQLPVERWLMILAYYLTHGQKDQKDPNPNLEWWNLRGLAPGWLVPAVIGAVCGVPTAVAAATGTHVGVGIGIGFGTGMLISIGVGVMLFRLRRNWDQHRLTEDAFDKRYKNRRPGPGMTGGVIGAVIGGMLAGVAGLHHIGHQASLFSGVPEALGMALGAGASTDFLGGLTGVLLGAFAGGYLAAVGLGLPAGLVNGAGVGVAVALAIDQVGRRKPSRTLPKWDRGIGIAGGSVIGLATGAIVWRETDPTLGIALGLLAGALAAAPFGLRHMDETLENVPSPGEALARDTKAFRLTAISAGLAAGAVGFLGGSMTSIFEVHGKATLGSVLSDGIGIGVASGLVVGLTFGFYHAASPEFRIITWWLAIQRKAPWRFKHFLDRAYNLTVLRQSGASYQFRHMELQERLADQYGAARQKPRREHLQPADNTAEVEQGTSTSALSAAAAPAASAGADPDAS
jgi:NACHT domain